MRAIVPQCAAAGARFAIQESRPDADVRKCDGVGDEGAVLAFGMRAFCSTDSLLSARPLSLSTFSNSLAKDQFADRWSRSEPLDHLSLWNRMPSGELKRSSTFNSASDGKLPNDGRRTFRS
jgi:hypothetical protein